MKPRDLKARYQSFDDRHPIFEDMVLCVPRFFNGHNDFVMPSFASPEVFGRKAPIAIEFCSGNGEWIIRMAKENPDLNWIAVERQFKRVRKIWSKMKNDQIKNLLIICGNAEDYCEHYLQPGDISKIYINFPDPWPKDRHAKHRLLQDGFASQMGEVAGEGCEVFIVTDDVVYSEQIIRVMNQNSYWESAYDEPYYTTHVDGYGSSFFRRLWEGQGKETRFMKFTKSYKMEGLLSATTN